MMLWLRTVRDGIARRVAAVRHSPYAFAIPWLVGLAALLGVLATPQLWHRPPTMSDYGIVSVTNESARTVIWSPEYEAPYPSNWEDSGYWLSAGATIRVMNYGGLYTRMKLLDPVTCKSSEDVAMSTSGYATISADGHLNWRPAKDSEMGPLPTGSPPYARTCSGHARGESQAAPHEGTLLANGDDQIWRLGPDGSAARFMPDAWITFDAHPMSDGRFVVTRAPGLSDSDYASVWLADPATGNWSLFRDHAGGGTPSPDGKWIAYESAGTNGWGDLRIGSVGGADDRPLAASVAAFVWAPDSASLAVVTVATPGTDDYRLSVIDLGGSRTELISNVGYEPSLDWSPDGTRIVVGVHGSKPDDFETASLVIMDPAGRETGRIAMGGDPLGYAVFSPDGLQLAFLRITYPYPNNAEVDDLFVASGDGSNPRLIDDRAFSGRPVWSPSGGALAIYRMEEMGPDQLTIAFLDGRPRQAIAEGMSPLWWGA